MPVTSPALESAPCVKPRIELLPVELPKLSAIDCKTTKDWERWSDERRAYEDPYAPIGGRF